MVDTFTGNLRLRKPEVGAHDDAWAALLNELSVVVEQAIAGAYYADVTAGNVTLSASNGIEDQARRMMIFAIGTQVVTTRTITLPDTPKFYVFANDSAQLVTFVRSSGGASVAVIAGQTCFAIVTSAGVFEAPLFATTNGPVMDVANVTTLTLDILGTHGAGDATCSMEYIVQGSWVFVNIETFTSQDFSSVTFALDRTASVDWPAEMVPAHGCSVPCLVTENGVLVPAYLNISSSGSVAWGITKVDGTAWLGTGTDDRTMNHSLSFSYVLRSQT